MSTLSVVITHYNQPNLLLRALAAFDKQTREPDEIIIVDDGSTSDVWRCPEMKAPIDKIRVIVHPENRGVVAAMNTGLSHSTGDFVYFAACDDRVAPRFVERSMSILETHAHKSPLICCAKSRWHDQRTGLEWVDSKRMNRHGWINGAEVAEYMRRGELHVTSHTAVIRTHWLKASLGFTEMLKWHCDFEVTHDAAIGQGVCFVSDTLVDVALTPDSYSDRGIGSKEHFGVMVHLLEVCMDGCPGWVKRIIRSRCLTRFGLPMIEAVLCCDAGKPLRTFDFFRHALWHEAQSRGRKHLPVWAQRLAMKLL